VAVIRKKPPLWEASSLISLWLVFVFVVDNALANELVVEGLHDEKGNVTLPLLRTYL
jgi:hypothetical protein